MEAATKERANNKAEHAAYVEEAQVAIDTIDECVDLLDSLDTGAATLL